ncbi:excalibur calcium-binding domain-containing protein [Derxia lacustris]|uniref:excalibur calcium-binding domain-containing protein n=1 Tax=Derxia lacustris TaxID=764842 RepID=UPI000A173BFE|nr:excalibur calcium-binding domain-containing protein [Derxia lacustris]
MRQQGKLKKWNAERGFGFIAVRGAADVFVHIGAFPYDGQLPRVGETLWFEPGSDKRGRPCALRLSRSPDPLPPASDALPPAADPQSSADLWPAPALTLEPIQRRAPATDSAPLAPPPPPSRSPHRPRRALAEPRRRSRLPVLLAAVALAVAGAISAWQDHRSARPAQTLADPPADSFALPAPAAASYQCNGRTLCSQMSSCAEATWVLRNCPGTQMDGDNDGIPCESQLCGQ